MLRKIFLTIAVATVILISGFVFYVERNLPFGLWNCGPIVIAAIVGGVLIHRSKMKRPLVWIPFATFFLLVVISTVFYHLAWLFDWDHTATGSSTSALGFIFLPIWTCVIAAALALLIWLVSFAAIALSCREKH